MQTSEAQRLKLRRAPQPPSVARGLSRLHALLFVQTAVITVAYVLGLTATVVYKLLG